MDLMGPLEAKGTIDLMGRIERKRDYGLGGSTWEQEVT